MEIWTLVASSNLSIGTWACEAGCVVDDETRAWTEGDKSVRQNLVHLCPSLSSDGHRSCKPRVPHLIPSHSPPWPPPPLGPPTSPNTQPTPTSGSQTSVHRSSLHLRNPEKLIELSPLPLSSTTQYVARKAQPIKRVDSEPLWRKDIQYDFLYYIFSDRTRAFVDRQAPDRPVVNFCDLYVNALYNSSKCSKVLKDKMVETPAFAIEFAKISLLTNVGRINTTMACRYLFPIFLSPPPHMRRLIHFALFLVFPEMKTALRSYHPVPSLQKTDGNLQDAPRIKNCLKAALLPSEEGTAPSTPNAILDNAVSK